ncbi:glycosyl hydrolase family 26, partial [Streptomyces sp. ZEA17I]
SDLPPVDPTPPAPPTVPPTPTAPPTPVGPEPPADREWCVTVPFGDWLSQWLKDRKFCFRF